MKAETNFNIRCAPLVDADITVRSPYAGDAYPDSVIIELICMDRPSKLTLRLTRDEVIRLAQDLLGKL